MATKILSRKMRIRIQFSHVPVAGMAVGSIFGLTPRRWLNYEQSLGAVINHLLQSFGGLSTNSYEGSFPLSEPPETDTESGCRSCSSSTSMDVKQQTNNKQQLNTLSLVNTAAATMAQGSVNRGVRFPIDLDHAIERFRQQNAPNLTKSDIMRFLIKRGLDDLNGTTESNPTSQDDTIHIDNTGKVLSESELRNAQNEEHLKFLKCLAKDWATLEIDTKRKQIRYAKKHGYLDQLQGTVNIEFELLEEVQQESTEERRIDF